MAKNFMVYVQHNNWSVIRWCVGMSVLGMRTTITCFCSSMIPPSKYIWLNRARMSCLMLSQLTLKNYRHILSLAGALLQATLLTAAFSSSSVMRVSRMSLHPSRKVLCPAFSIRVTHASSTLIRSYLFCRNSINVSRTSVVVVCYTVLVDNAGNDPRQKRSLKSSTYRSGV
jgi:hypothetical protein